MIDWNKVRSIVMICAAIGWWGLLFPEFAVWSDSVRAQKSDVQNTENVVEYESARDIYEGLMHADRDQIKIRSKLLDMIRECMGE